jgi:hypothetical protein
MRGLVSLHRQNGCVVRLSRFASLQRLPLKDSLGKSWVCFEAILQRVRVFGLPQEQIAQGFVVVQFARYHYT